MPTHITAFSKIQRIVSWIFVASHILEMVQDFASKFRTQIKNAIVGFFDCQQSHFGNERWTQSRKIEKQNCFISLIVVKATVLKLHILSTLVSFYIYDRPLTDVNVIAGVYVLDLGIKVWHLLFQRFVDSSPICQLADVPVHRHKMLTCRPVNSPTGPLVNVSSPNC